MQCGYSCGLLKSVAAVGGLVVAGMGGYNALTTGCVFGMCSTEARLEASIVPTSNMVEGVSCCDGGSKLEACAEAPCETTEAATEVAQVTETAPTDATLPATQPVSTDSAPTGG